MIFFPRVVYTEYRITHNGCIGCTYLFSTDPFFVVLFFCVGGDVMNHDLQLMNIVFVCTDFELL